METINIYTDGACKGNPGPGGYGLAAFIDSCCINFFSCTEEDTTNNRQELKAIITALEWAETIYSDKKVCIYSDSAYCVNMINSWIHTWAKNNWKNSKKQIVENLDLVQTIYNYINKDFFNCQVEIIKISGHSGNPYNEFVDALATQNDKKKEKIIHDFSITFCNEVSIKNF